MSRSLSRTALSLRPSERIAAQKCTAPRQTWPLLDDRSRLIQSATQCQRLPQRRLFSSSTPHANGQIPKMKRQSTPSMAVQTKQQREKMMATNGMPDDMGLQPETFVMPPMKNLPFLLSKDRFDIEWARLKVRAREWLTVQIYRWWYVRKHHRYSTQVIKKHAVPGIAKQLHHDTFTAYADGNLEPVQDKICQGFFNSLRSRLQNRAPNSYSKWTVHKYISVPRLMSYKINVIPPKNDKKYVDGVIQAVVKIHSLQSLQHFQRRTKRARGQGVVTETKEFDIFGQEVPEGSSDGGLKNAKETTEYVVIQKSVRKNNEGPWMIWGTTEPMTMQALRESQKIPGEEKK